MTGYLFFSLLFAERNVSAGQENVGSRFTRSEKLQFTQVWLQTLIQSLWYVDYQCRLADSSHISTALPVCLSSDGSNNQRVVRWKFSVFNLGWRKGIGCGGGHCWKCGSKNRHGGGRFGLLLLYINRFIYLIYVICIYILLSFFDYFGVNVNNSYCIFLTVVIMLVVVMAFETFIHFIYQFL